MNIKKIEQEIKEEKIEKAVYALSLLKEEDEEVAHIEADKILLDFVPAEIAEAYRNLKQKVGFWYA